MPFRCWCGSISVCRCVGTQIILLISVCCHTLCSHSSVEVAQDVLALTPATLSAGETSFDAAHDAEQLLDSEGDTATLFVLAATSSGATLWPLAPAELTAGPLSASLDVSRPAPSSPWQAAVTTVADALPSQDANNGCPGSQ